jgi:predicted Zn-dependent protease
MAYGRLAELQDNKTKIAWSRLVKLHAGKALALDPANETACHVLGCWHYELANLNPVLRALARVIYGRLPDASNAEAAALFQKAIALNPRRARNHIELGRTYAAMGRTADARAMLEKGLATPSHDADDTDAKARARKALDAL